MKRILALMLVLLVIMATGCIFGDDDKDGSKDTVGSYQAAEYMPLDLGSSLTYLCTDQYSGTTEEYNYTLRIAGAIQVEGHQYMILSNEYESSTDTTYAAVRDNIFWIYQKPWDMTAKAMIERSPLPVAAKTAVLNRIAATEDHWPMIDFNQPSWEIHSESMTEEDFSYTMSMTGTFEGVEDVTTPAGTFAKCLKFSIVTSSYESYSYNGVPDTWSATDTQYIYLAKNIGPVKTAGQASYNDGPMEDSSTEVLTAYSAGD